MTDLVDFCKRFADKFSASSVHVCVCVCDSQILIPTSLIGRFIFTFHKSFLFLIVFCFNFILISDEKCHCC